MSAETRARAVIDLAALARNYGQVARHCPGAGVLPVIKADAYGHGVAEVAPALAGAQPRPAGLAVATLDEALALADLQLGLPIILLGGYVDAAELAACMNAAADIEPVIHGEHQLAPLEAWLAAGGAKPRRLWIKANTGMNRLGLAPGAVATCFARFKQAGVPMALMSHLARADEGMASDGVQQQLARFRALHRSLCKQAGSQVETSLVASAGVLAQAPGNAYVRPGIMLYGGSPFPDRTGAELGLEPVMTLRARLMAVQMAAAGEAVGYGGAYICTEPTRLGVVSIGYGDGYPRSAPTGTPALVMAGGVMRESRLLGRVSMDMIILDLNAAPEAQVGDEVILWGPGLPADRVASAAGTISYELFCRVNRQRVAFVYRR